VTEPEPAFLAEFARHREPAASGLDWLGENGAVGASRILAEILATVELERVLAGLGLGAEEIAAALLDPLLGARVVIVPAAIPDQPAVALVEPSTEGRLAATLARHGEGPIGRYVEATMPLDDVRARAAAAGVALSRQADGPFGPEILVLNGPVTGPHLVLVEPAAVPSRP
jgi:hypothetical protein